MFNEAILEKLKQIPKKYLQEVSDFIDFILWRDEQKRKASNNKKSNAVGITDSLTGSIPNTGKTLDEYRAERLDKLEKFRGRIPANFDFKQELAEARDEKYNSTKV